MSEDDILERTYIDSALFIFSDDSKHLIESIQNNPFKTQITTLAFDEFNKDPKSALTAVNHVVVSGSLDNIKAVFKLAMAYKFSVGWLLLESQKEIQRSLEQPKDLNSAIELALRKNSQLIDIILCNGQIVLNKASLGRVPLLDTVNDIGFFDFFTKALIKLKDMKLLKFSFITANDKKINTAASGCMILQHYTKSLASKLIQHDSSMSDGSISLVITSPFSVIDYLKFIIQTWHRTSTQKKLPSGVGFIKSSKITIETEMELGVFIDGKNETHTPAHFEVIKNALNINLGDWLEQESNKTAIAKERIRIDNIPDEKELQKSIGKNITFFSYASEQRFRDLFLSLREDSKVNSTFIVLMLLSTALATFGLYLNSAAVIIGAMLLAPLMNPIVSISMGLLRQDKGLFDDSAKKILLGISLALFVSMLIALMFPHKPVTPEMLGRLNPTLLDLAVAIISGIAAAYSKSYKEVMQSLAGVAIAVALVPPLAVAGVGLGQADLGFFLQAFLLFSTNLVGIILAASLTFRVLGYSPVVKNKRGMLFVVLSLALISIPLYLSYKQIVNTLVLQKKIEKERFLINDKYIIIKNVRITYSHDKKIIDMNIYTRDTLSRWDMDKLKQKIQLQFDEKLFLRTQIIYIL
ncbi:MAG: TIGR00341 family protein [Gammaproteobacteria bacterium]